MHRYSQACLHMQGKYGSTKKTGRPKMVDMIANNEVKRIAASISLFSS
jgi:hypothetical protein